MTRKKITMYGTEEQKEQIEIQASKHGQTVSKYCLEAVEQRIAREVRDERADEVSIEDRIETLVSDVQKNIDSVIDPAPEQELLYEIALWQLLSSEYSAEQRQDALESGAEKFEKELENLATKRGED
ncbi:hypothetical protein [Haloarcula halophila]|uniref:hypothetical protein n=1 Tax=Haloarcula TaxID=2237 RepID=UPI0023E3AD10|nr:hypothetical protein [Halomicroarcula sp. DFY41]